MRRVYTTALATLALLGAAQAQANYTKTKHPIVLVHGITGFPTALGRKAVARQDMFLKAALSD